MAVLRVAIRGLSILQVLLGFLMIACGIVDRLYVRWWISYAVLPCWSGGLVLIDAMVGFAVARKRKRSSPHPNLVNGFVSVSLLCAVLASLIIHWYIQFLGQAVLQVYHPGNNFTVNDAISADKKNITLSRKEEIQFGVGSTIVGLAVAELFVAIWVSLSCRRVSFPPALETWDEPIAIPDERLYIRSNPRNSIPLNSAGSQAHLIGAGSYHSSPRSNSEPYVLAVPGNSMTLQHIPTSHRSYEL